MKKKRDEEVLYGIHPVEEALRSGAVEIEKIFLSRGGAKGKAGPVLKMARQKGIPVSNVPTELLRRISGTDRHQGIVATLSATRYCAREEILRSTDDRSVLLMLDGVEDPGNLGAIVRTAVATGVAGIFIPARSAAGMTGAAAKRSAGAIVHARIAREKSLVSLAEELKRMGFQLIAVENDGKEGLFDFSFHLPLAIVLGSEKSGISKELRGKVDAVVRIPLDERVESLNVSVAAGVILYEIMRKSLTRK